MSCVSVSIADLLARLELEQQQRPSKRYRRRPTVAVAAGSDTDGGGGGGTGTPTTVRCPMCDRGYVHRQNMLNHMRWECGQRLMFGCCYCAHRTKLKGNLKKHIATIHRDRLVECGRPLVEVLAECDGVRPSSYGLVKGNETMVSMPGHLPFDPLQM